MKTAHSLLFSFILLVLLVSFPANAYSQKVAEVELEGGMVANDLDLGIAFDVALKYNYWFNPYVGLSAGVKFITSTIDHSFDSPTQSKVSYRLDDRIFEFNALAGIKLATPTIGNVGLMADAYFQFAPVPYNWISAKKLTYNSADFNYSEEKTKTSAVYTKFNPSYLLQLGVFYDIKDGKYDRLRIAAGCGMSNHNSYNAYYRAEVDGIPLKDHLELRPDKIGLVLFVRLSLAL